MTPFPEYPALQAQVKLPKLFVQIAFVWHPPLFVEHSSISSYWKNLEKENVQKRKRKRKEKEK